MLRHHPDTVTRQAWDYTSIKHSKEWNKIAGMTAEGRLIYRWNLVKTMLIQEGMTDFVRNWRSFLPAEVQNLPLCRHEHYAGETLMDHFIAEFQVRPLREHYKQELERMRSELVAENKVNMETLSSRAFKVQHIYVAAPDLDYLVYVSAVVSPFPETSPLIQSLYQRTLHLTAWPEFFRALKEMVSSKERWGVEVFSRNKKTEELKSALKDNNSGGHTKKLTWAEMRAKDSRDKTPYGLQQRKRKFGGSRMNTVQTSEEEDEEGDSDEDEEQDGEDDSDTRYFRITSKMNSLRMENKSLRKQLMTVVQQPSQDQTALASAINTMTTFMQSQSKQGNRSSDSLSTTTPSSGYGSHQDCSSDSKPSRQEGPSRKRSRTNSNKPMEKQGGGGAKSMDKYGPNSGGARGRGADSFDRYQHNPAGPEPWKRWLRVCSHCGCHGGHFGTQCQGELRPNFNRHEDPRAVKPIEPYPATREAALARCRQEYRTYGSRVRWNCKDHEAPTPQELA